MEWWTRGSVCRGAGREEKESRPQPPWLSTGVLSGLRVRLGDNLPERLVRPIAFVRLDAGPGGNPPMAWMGALGQGRAETRPRLPRHPDRSPPTATRLLKMPFCSGMSSNAMPSFACLFMLLPRVELTLSAPHKVETFRA